MSVSALLTAFQDANKRFGVDIPQVDWATWGNYTRPYRKGDLPIPGAYYCLSVPNDDAERLAHNLSLDDEVTVIKATQYTYKPSMAYLILHVASFRAREELAFPRDGSELNLLLG